MTYQEKLERADQVCVLISKGNSLFHCTKELKMMGYNTLDCDRIIDSALVNLRSKFKMSIKGHMLQGTLEDNISAYDELSPEIFEKFQYELIDEISTETSDELRQKLSQGYNRDELREEMCHEYYEESQFDKVLEEYDETKTRSSTSLMAGLAILVISVALSIITSGGVTVFIFYGLLAVAGIHIIRQT